MSPLPPRGCSRGGIWGPNQQERSRSLPWIPGILGIPGMDPTPPGHPGLTRFGAFPWAGRTWVQFEVWDKAAWTPQNVVWDNEEQFPVPPVPHGDSSWIWGREFWCFGRGGAAVELPRPPGCVLGGDPDPTGIVPFPGVDPTPRSCVGTESLPWLLSSSLSSSRGCWDAVRAAFPCSTRFQPFIPSPALRDPIPWLCVGARAGFGQRIPNF